MLGLKMTMPEAPRERHRDGAGRAIAGAVVLIAVAVFAAVAFYASRQPATTAFPGSMMILGGGAVLAGLVVWIRTSGLADALETICDAALGLLSLIGAVLSAIWSAILGLFGWD